MRHTPGPWTATGWKGTAVNDSVGTTLCLYPQGTGSGLNQVVANARLIAAAPELLEALQAVILTFDSNNVPVPDYLKRNEQQARAAITKATEGTP